MVIKIDGTVVTQEGFENSRQASLFPLLPLVSGGLMSETLEAGDTVYVPESLSQPAKRNPHGVLGRYNEDHSEQRQRAGGGRTAGDGQAVAEC